MIETQQIWPIQPNIILLVIYSHQVRSKLENNLYFCGTSCTQQSLLQNCMKHKFHHPKKKNVTRNRANLECVVHSTEYKRQSIDKGIVCISKMFIFFLSNIFIPMKCARAVSLLLVCMIKMKQSLLYHRCCASVVSFFLFFFYVLIPLHYFCEMCE